MPGEPRKVVAVHPAKDLAARPRLFEALEAAFPVEFRPWASGAEADAVIAFADGPGVPDARELERRHRVPVLAVIGDPCHARLAERVRFADRRLRGILLADRLAGACLRPARGEEVLADAPSGAVWTRAMSRYAPVERVRSVLPEVPEGSVLYGLLSQR